MHHSLYWIFILYHLFYSESNFFVLLMAYQAKTYFIVISIFSPNQTKLIQNNFQRKKLMQNNLINNYFTIALL